MAKKFKFNLLKKKGGTFFSEVDVFVKSYAKYIIVLTQFIVLSVFFVKIVFDQQIIDLKEAIDQKNQIILTSESMIQSNNQLAQKIITLDGILNNMQGHHTTINTVLENIPQSVTLESLSLGQKTLFFSGETFGAPDIKKMQKRLTDKLQTSVTIEKVEKDRNLFLFQMAIPVTQSEQ